MAIDHVRVYSGMPAGGPEPGIFFTRWVTHFCAPAFAFFAGTSAFLYGNKLLNKRKLAGFLITRGLLLVVLELTIIRFCWMFNFNYANFTLAGVIWMLGWCMVLLSAFIRLQPMTIGIIGLSVIFLQQFFQYVPLALPVDWRNSFGHFWEFIYPSGLEGMPGIAILYVLVPWLGVMMTGYGFGNILLLEAKKRKRICLWIGLSAIAVFLITATIIILSQPASPDSPAFIFRLLNQQKYPASQLYLLMTLGPLIALIPWAENINGRFANALNTIGRVPMFYYILHILLIHISALIVNIMKEGAAHQEWYTTAPFTQMPEENRWGLPLLYLVFIIDVCILYFICRWYAKYKIAHPQNKWLKYL
jgi:uncharacterized membrane protein